MLAGASAPRSNGTAVPVVNPAPKQNSDATDQKAQSETSAEENTQAQSESDLTQSVVLPVVSKSTVAPARVPQTSAASNASGTNRANGREAKPQTAPAGPAGNSIAVTTALIAIPAVMVPVQTAPAAAMQVPPPASTTQIGDSIAPAASPAQGVLPASSTNTNGSRTDPAGNGIELATPSTNSTQNQVAQSTDQNVKFAVEIFDPSLGSTAQSDLANNPNRSQSKDQASGLADNVNGSSTTAATTAATPSNSINLPNFATLPSANDGTQPAANAVQNNKGSNSILPR